MFESLFYFAFGFTTCIYLYILISKFLKKTNDHEKTYQSPAKLYLNIYFLDKDEFLRNIVRNKVSRDKPLIRALAKRAAVALLSKGIVEKVATNLCTEIPIKLGRLGICSTVNIVYTKGAYVCIEISMNKIDIPSVIDYNVNSEASKKVKDWIDKYSFPMLNDFFNRMLLLFFMSKLIIKLPIQIKQKLQDKDADVEVIMCNEEEIGYHLTQTILQLNNTIK